MKVSMVTWEFPPHVYGGAGVHVAHLTEALRGRVDLEVRTRGSPTDPAPVGLRVRRYPTGVPGGFASGTPPPIEALSFNLHVLADPIDADIVHTHTWYANLTGALAKHLYGCRAVATVHSLEPLRPWKREQLGSGYEMSSWMEKEGLEACDAVIAVSEEMRRDIAASYPIPESRITVIHNGVDPEVFRPTGGSASLAKFRIQKPYVLFVGRLTRQKGVFDLLAAMKHVPSPAKLVLITGKPDTPEIEAQLAAALQGEDRVRWIPQMVAETDLVGLYGEASVFACPSSYEPFGIINLEAMACRVPVVATRVGGIPDVVVDGETGLLVPPGEPGELAAALRRVLEDPALASRLGAAGRKRVLENFTWERVAEKTLALYASLA